MAGRAAAAAGRAAAAPVGKVPEPGAIPAFVASAAGSEDKMDLQFELVAQHQGPSFAGHFEFPVVRIAVEALAEDRLGG